MSTYINTKCQLYFKQYVRKNMDLNKSDQNQLEDFLITISVVW